MLILKYYNVDFMIFFINCFLRYTQSFISIFIHLHSIYILYFYIITAQNTSVVLKMEDYLFKHILWIFLQELMEA